LDEFGSLKRMISGVTNSNGICWDQEKKLMYYIDTPTQKVIVYDYELASGKIENPRKAVDFTKFGVEGSPDGMTMDSEGMLWVAMCHGGAVLQVNPDTGELLRKVLLPCVETTACTFGGNRLDRLFVTTGIHKTLEEAGAGHVFVVDGLQAQGTPAQPYHG